LNFTRGSLIELSNGLLRRVEDLRTEDFVMSAEKSADLQLADSTVVKILPAPNNFVMITFSYDNNRSKVTLHSQKHIKYFIHVNFSLDNARRLTSRRKWNIHFLSTVKDGHRVIQKGQCKLSDSNVNAYRWVTFAFH
jgi:hypothetical protein